MTMSGIGFLQLWYVHYFNNADDSKVYHISYFFIFNKFLHAGIIHYAINVSALWFIGTAVELNHGSFATTILFILPALGGNLYSALFLSKYLVVGSSGGKSLIISKINFDKGQRFLTIYCY